MKRKWKIILLSGLILIIGWITISLFIVDLRFLKEEFLIKRNYYKNLSLFKKAIPIIDTLPYIDLNFRGDSYLFLEIPNQNFISDSIRSNLYEYPPTIYISDEIKEFHKDNYRYPLRDFWFKDSILYVNALDSVFPINGNWLISYRGDRQSDMLSKILKIVHIDSINLNAIQLILREINCSGFEKKNTENLIINYRTNFLLLDAFSYMIQSPSQNSSDLINKFYSKHGQLGNNIFWFHYERIPVEYFGYLKLENWNK